MRCIRASGPLQAGAEAIQDEEQDRRRQDRSSHP